MARKSAASKRAKKSEKSESVKKRQGAETSTQKVRVVGKPFKSGAEWNGNAAGRPKGSRNRLSENFLAALADDFDAHGVKAIKTVREEDPGKYLSVVAQLVPKETDINVKTDETFVALWKAVATGAVTSMLSSLDDDGEEAFH